MGEGRMLICPCDDQWHGHVEWHLDGSAFAIFMGWECLNRHSKIPLLLWKINLHVMIIPKITIPMVNNLQ